MRHVGILIAMQTENTIKVHSHEKPPIQDQPLVGFYPIFLQDRRNFILAHNSMNKILLIQVKYVMIQGQSFSSAYHDDHQQIRKQLNQPL